MTANAELHELGVTNAIFSAEDKPQGLSFPQACSIKTQPNDVNATQLINMYHYLLYLGPKTPGAPNPNGQAKFTSVGCILCHVQSYKTTATVTVPLVYPPTSTITSTSLANKTVKLYSDLLLHDLGGTNADGLQVGIATGTQFRTTPLWGLSTRLASGDGLMHDGKALDIPTVLSRHGGEATQVIANFNALSSPRSGGSDRVHQRAVDRFSTSKPAGSARRFLFVRCLTPAKWHSTMPSLSHLHS